jgi:N-formylglutamate amidohydrolase
MGSSDETSQDPPPPFDLRRPASQSLPFIYASPHSGAYYPPDFVAAAALDPLALRRSEDAFVNRLFGAAPDCGAPLLAATYPRVYVDLNREPYELDPAMFSGPLPEFVNTNSARVSVGLGTLARVVANGAAIYRGKIAFAEARARVERIYVPYHTALRRLIAQGQGAFGCAVLVDCHSMPSTGGPFDRDSGRRRGEIVLGDRFGTSCAGVIVDVAEKTMRGLGYRVRRNEPYAGGFVTQNYGRPGNGVHALQIEINRSLYMDEAAIEPGPGFDRLAQNLGQLIRALAEIDVKALRPAAHGEAAQ